MWTKMWIFLFSLGILTTSASPAPTIDTGDNSLWKSLNQCKDFSMDCIKKEFRNYLRDTFNRNDVEIAGFLRFTKNDVNYSALSDNSNSSDVDDDNADGLSPKAANPLEEVTRSMQDNAKAFLFTHDVEVSLPEFIFDGGVIRISPRAFHEDGGALVRLDMASERRSSKTDVGSPRLFKKIRKFIGERLMWALMALLLVVKLLSMKFMFFLPVIMGVAAAKKLLLKVILFVFPFLGHLFKLCPYYAPTKFHHHHHQISHHHQIPHLHDLHAGGIELDHPPPGWHEHHDDHHEHPGHHHHQHGDHVEDFGYYNDGPSFGAHDLGLRRKQYEYNKASTDEDGDSYNIGQGQPGYPTYAPEPNPYAPKAKASSHPPIGPSKIKSGPLSPAEIENMVLKAEKEAMLKARLQEEQKRVELENKRLQDKIKTSLKFQEKLKIQSLVAKQTSKIAAAYQPQPQLQPQLQPPQPPQQLLQPHIVHTSYVPSQQLVQALPQTHTQAIYPSQAVHHQSAPVYHNPTVLSALQAQMQQSAALNSFNSNVNRIGNTKPNAFDPFYSPILDKIDTIFNELAILEENCRERLVCNMYNDPEKYSPHSNLISAELSRDASELQKPTTSNSAVIRFYKYVQAARDGQDKRDCATLYPACMLGL